MREMTLDEIKKSELEILKYVADFCKKNRLKYYLAFGTLLGAVRHKGFIPWDDDIDIVMPREDYNKFIRLFNDSSNHYSLVCPENCNSCYTTFAKVIDMRTLLVEDVREPIEIGTFIDIFPLDSLSSSYKQACALVPKIKILSMLVTMMWHISDREERSAIKQFVVNVARFLSNFCSRHWMLCYINNIAQTYSNLKDSRFCGVAASLVFSEKKIMLSDWWQDVVQLDFEGYKFDAPKEYDIFLTHMYGDYMTLPPMEKRVSFHAFKAWWRKD